MSTIRPLNADTALCEYDDSNHWFSPAKGERRQAAAICSNCPVIISCAQRALRLGVTDGVWATVAMPGSRDGAALEAARQRLNAVIERYQHQPTELRLRSLRIRQAVHFAATQTELRRRHSSVFARPGATTMTEKASA
ncbi:WhiB family transcriptional regulator [Mycobacterium kansasii]|uniref:WhiB family transcriptional regulator n=1 Tax=Mycobacterium kansasii TaxID=1768 RepID=UPI0004D643FB|nr:WhiB family transcriptional regulator [Mycobacterium kansasii]KEP41875.1 transcriptional regulatory protein [Mycobacterium kansasii]